MIDGNRLEMTDPENLRLLIERGMRAQLQAQSLVTGLLFVQIDFFPDTPVTYVLPQPSTPMEIPTVPTTLEQASSAAREIIEELRSIKFGPMVQTPPRRWRTSTSWSARRRCRRPSTRCPIP